MRINDELRVGKPKGQRSNYAKKREGLSPPSLILVSVSHALLTIQPR